MELIRGLIGLRAHHRGCVATIGNYDGVHLGHQQVLRELRQQATSLGLPTTVITFEPTPQEFFLRANAPARLSRLPEKLVQLQAQGVDRVVVLHFNRMLASMEPEDFIRRLLLEGLGVRHLVVGDDFRFGHQRRGDFALLEAWGRQHGFSVERMSAYLYADRRVSSSWVREALARQDLELAQQLLGQPYAMMGKVMRGDQLGRELGFPTANLALRRLSSPLHGIYAVAVNGLAATPWPGVASLGTRPTVDGRRWVLEVYLLDWQQDIYGRCLEVAFLQHLRNEEKYDTLAALQHQIALDVTQARTYFQTHPLVADTPSAFIAGKKTRD